MNNIGNNLFNLGYMDTLSEINSPLHRLDPRIKLITALVFIATVVSFNKYAVSGLIPFFIYPIILIFAGGLPFGYFAKKVLLVSPFVLLIGVFNPIMDRDILLHIGSLDISGGWISFFSIILKFILTVSAALVLVSLTGFNAVCESLEKLGVPKVFVVQLLFFYRYIFVLTDETERVARARSLRALNSRTMDFKTFISVVSHLLLRTLERAERIYRAMCCRGFDGNIRLIRSTKIRFKDFAFLFAWAALFLFFRYFNISIELGKLITGF